MTWQVTNRLASGAGMSLFGDGGEFLQVCAIAAKYILKHIICKIKLLEVFQGTHVFWKGF